MWNYQVSNNEMEKKKKKKKKKKNHNNGTPISFGTCLKKFSIYRVLNLAEIYNATLEVLDRKICVFGCISCS